MQGWILEFGDLRQTLRKGHQTLALRKADMGLGGWKN